MAGITYKKLNLLGKAVVRQAYPVSFVLNILGLIWAGYFLWLHYWMWAIVCMVFMSVGGFLSASLDRTYFILAKSQLNSFQTLLVYHAHPANLILHLIGLACYGLGTWFHSFPFLLVAISFVLLGNIFPWLSHKKEERLFTLMIDEDVSAKEDEE